jgi:hypothetical protein
LGLLLARLHPALALVFIVPFMPGPGIHALKTAAEKQAGMVHRHIEHEADRNTSHPEKVFSCLN